MKQWLWRLGIWLNRRGVRFVLAAAVVGFLIGKVDGMEVARHLAGFDPVFGVAISGIFLLLLGLFALRWWYIATALGVRAPFGEFVRTMWASQAVSECGPPLVMGELARFQLMRDFGDTWQLAAGQAIDRLSGKVVLFVIVAALTPVYLGLYEQFPVLQIALFALIIVAAVSVGVLVFRHFWPVARGHARSVLRACNPLRTPQHYALSLLIQWLLAINLSLTAQGLGVSHDVPALLVLGPLLLLGVSSLPGLVSDWGKREAAAVILLAPAGLTPEESLAVSLVFGALHLLVALPGALFLLANNRGRRKPPR